MSDKLIVTAGLTGLSEEEFYTDTKGKVQAEIDNPTIVPAIDPAPLTVMPKITAYRQLLDDRINLVQQVKQKTTAIRAARKEINGIMVDNWPSDIQKAVGGDIGKVQLLHFGVKNEGEGELLVSITNSHPVITHIDINQHLQHTLTFRNNESGHLGLPDDAKHIDVYESIGATEPTDIKKMTYLGTASRGRFTNHFTEEQVGLVIWYVALYIGKKSAGATSSELSGKIRSTVV